MVSQEEFDKWNRIRENTVHAETNFDWVLHEYQHGRCYYDDWRELRKHALALQHMGDGRDFDCFSVSDPSGDFMYLTDLHDINECLECNKQVDEEKLVINKNGQWCKECWKNVKDEYEEVELNPNCSEIIWRLGGIKMETDTASYPNGCLESMLDVLREHPRAELSILDNCGGGGNSDFVEKCFNLAKKIVKKEIQYGVHEEGWKGVKEKKKKDYIARKLAYGRPPLSQKEIEDLERQVWENEDDEDVDNIIESKLQ